MADAIAPGSDYNRRWQQANGADVDKIEPIHNGIDLNEFASTPANVEHPTLVWVGRIDPLKDVKTLLRAFARVRLVDPERTPAHLRRHTTRQRGVPPRVRRSARRTRSRRQCSIRGPRPIDLRRIPQRRRRRRHQHLRGLPVRRARGHGLRSSNDRNRRRWSVRGDRRHGDHGAAAGRDQPRQRVHRTAPQRTDCAHSSHPADASVSGHASWSSSASNATASCTTISSMPHASRSARQS